MNCSVAKVSPDGVSRGRLRWFGKRERERVDSSAASDARHPFAAFRSVTRLAALFCLLVFAGCAARFVAPYDDTTERLLTDLTVRTQSVVAKADAGQLTETERVQFYADAEGVVQTMQMRASLYARNEPEIAALEDLAERYRDLREHRAMPRTSLSTGLRATLLDLQQIQVAKKRSSAFSSRLKKSAATH